MSYTEQDVERAAPRVWAEDYFFCHGTYPDEADPPVRWEDIPEAFRVHARALSRAALEAIEREPLDGNVEHIHAAADEVEAYLSMAADEEETLEVVMGREKYSIASAALRGVDNIRNAVVAAKGETPQSMLEASDLDPDLFGESEASS